MAIAFRSAGAAASQDIGSFGNPLSVPTPAGFASGDYLVMCLLQDSNTNETSPAGWTKICMADPGQSGLYGYASPRLTVYGKVATGAEGPSVAVTYSTANWPTGDPYVVGFMAAYTGVSPGSPVDLYATRALIGPQSAAQTHPQANTSAGDWLLTIRGSSSGAVYTVTDSVGTDVQRQIATGFSELTLAMFDSNAATTAGLQTQRTTTTSGAPSQGVSMVTLALFPSSTNATTAIAQTANVAATVSGTTGTPTEQPWSASCGQGSLPAYCWAIDWAQSGMTADGKILNSNPFLDTGDLTGWGFTNSTVSYVKTPLGLRTLPTVHVVPNGSSASGGLNGNPHTAAGSVTAGNSYVADCWVYSPNGWSDLRACIDWYDSSDTFLSTGLGSATVVPAGVWTHLRQVLKAPANASRAGVRARFGSTPPTTADYYVWGLVVMDPTIAETRILPDATAVVQADIVSNVTFAYGRDQNRQLTPAAIGSGGFTLTNKDRVFSPEYTSGPLYGTLDAARQVRGQAVYNGVAYNLFAGYLNDYTVNASRADRSVVFTVQDAISLVQQTPVSTGLYRGIRTGDAIKVILAAIGWTGPTDIDPGSTIMPYWWLDNVNVPTAIDDLVLSEGAPAIAYAAPDGTFVFRDRAHRILRPQSLNVQASFASAQLGNCAAPAVTGLSYGEPFTYTHGWRDIINSVSFDVQQRVPAAGYSSVWSSTNPLSLTLGQSVTVTATASDPFFNAIVPVAGTDYHAAGAGTVQVTLNRTSGQTVQITYLAVGGSVTLTGLQLRAISFPVVQTVTVAQTDSTSIAQHGQQNYPNQAPWVGVGDALAIGEVVLLRYAQRRPVVQVIVHSTDPNHYVNGVMRTLSDLVNIENDELGLNEPFYVEHVVHTIERMNPLGQPPVHSVTLACEAQVSQLSAPPFTFDQRGAGFNNGVFSPVSADNPANVWIWDTQSVFDQSEFAT